MKINVHSDISERHIRSVNLVEWEFAKEIEISTFLAGEMVSTITQTLEVTE